MTPNIGLHFGPYGNGKSKVWLPEDNQKFWSDYLSDIEAKKELNSRIYYPSNRVPQVDHGNAVKWKPPAVTVGN
jgi:hypothetical protein